ASTSYSARLMGSPPGNSTVGEVSTLVPVLQWSAPLERSGEDVAEAVLRDDVPDGHAYGLGDLEAEADALCVPALVPDVEVEDAPAGGDSGRAFLGLSGHLPHQALHRLLRAQTSREDRGARRRHVDDRRPL